MDLILSYKLTDVSLAFVSLVPFLYFAYHARYSYRPDITKTYDFLFTLISATLAVIVLIKLGLSSMRGNGLSVPTVRLYLLHLAPLILSLLITSQGRRAGRSQGSSGAVTMPKSGDGSMYAPAPSDQGIEKFGWNQLIIEDDLKQELQSVVTLLKDPETAKKYGIEVPKGILLNGPPGTGKTTIARVIATTANLSFFALKMDEVVSKWVGESEKNLSRLFEAAVAHAPSVIFIDEVDSIGKSRSGGGQVWAENLLNHLLQLIDGIVKTEGLYIIAATNRADLVDSALKRAGRLNRVIEIPLPHYEARLQLFQLYLSKLKLQDSLDVGILAEITEGKSAADIKEICNQAGLNAFKRESQSGNKKRDYFVTYEDLEIALSQFMQPSSTEKPS